MSHVKNPSRYGKNMSEIGFGNHKLLFQQILALYVELDRLLPSHSGLPTVLHMSGQLKGDNRTLMFQELLRPWKHFGCIETLEASCFTRFHHQGERKQRNHNATTSGVNIFEDALSSINFAEALSTLWRMLLNPCFFVSCFQSPIFLL